MKYIMTYDLHTHTTYSHGKGSIEDNVKVAHEKGLKGIAITDHGRDHHFYGIKGDALTKMRAEIEVLKPKYPGMEIYLSVEANIHDGGNGTDIRRKEKADCDFAIAGYHYGTSNGYCVSNFLFNKGIINTAKREAKIKKRNTEMIVRALDKNEIKVLTHPGDKAIVDIVAIAKACERNNILMEISAHHDNLTVEQLKIVAEETKVLFIINSDAHRPEHVGTFQPALDRVLKSGIDIERVINIEIVEEDEDEKIIQEIGTEEVGVISTGNGETLIEQSTTKVEPTSYLGIRVEEGGQIVVEQTMVNTSSSNVGTNIASDFTGEIKGKQSKFSKRMKPIVGVQTSMDLGFKIHEDLEEPK